jgi:hypothetical protein
MLDEISSRSSLDPQTVIALRIQALEVFHQQLPRLYTRQPVEA